MKRTDNGVAVFTTDTGQDVVALDAIAKLAGVNLGAVARVFAALAITAHDTGILLADLVEFDNMPLAAPDAMRAAATNEFWDGITEREADSDEGLFLRLSQRCQVVSY